MKRFFLAALAIVTLGVAGVLFAPEATTVFADAKADVCAGLQSAAGGSGCVEGNGPTVNTVINAVINILSWVVGIISVIMIIVGGFKYVTSGGDSSNVQSAKNTVIYALIGVVIVAISQTLVKFVLNQLFPEIKK